MGTFKENEEREGKLQAKGGKKMELENGTFSENLKAVKYVFSSKLIKHVAEVQPEAVKACRKGILLTVISMLVKVVLVVMGVMYLTQFTDYRNNMSEVSRIWVERDNTSAAFFTGTKEFADGSTMEVSYSLNQLKNLGCFRGIELIDTQIQACVYYNNIGGQDISATTEENIRAKAKEKAEEYKTIIVWLEVLGVILVASDLVLTNVYAPAWANIRRKAVRGEI